VELSEEKTPGEMGGAKKDGKMVVEERFSRTKARLLLGGGGNGPYRPTTGVFFILGERKKKHY